MVVRLFLTRKTWHSNNNRGYSAERSLLLAEGEGRVGLALANAACGAGSAQLQGEAGSTASGADRGNYAGSVIRGASGRCASVADW